MPRKYAGAAEEMKLAKETWIIMAIGMADLFTTILFIQHHGAEEANPLFKHYWEMGLAVFIFAKVALLIAPLSILEWARQQRPRFTAWALRGAIVAYLLMYCVGYVRLNHTKPSDIDMSDIETPAYSMRNHVSIHVRPIMH